MIRLGLCRRSPGRVALVASIVGLVGTAQLGSARIPATASAATSLPQTASTSTISVHYNQRYGPGPLEVLDVYRSTTVRGWRPAVLLIHGGGWHTGSKDGWYKVADQLADAGFVAVPVDYQLTTPTSPGFPVQVHQLKAAVEWLRAHAATYGIDSRHIGALGSSAGANLVAMLATDAWGPLDSGSRLGAAVTWSAMLDLAHQPGLIPDIPNYVGCLTNCTRVLNDASPLHHVSGGDTPMEVFNSTHELVPLHTVETMDAELTAAGVVHTMVIYDGTEHGVTYADEAMPTSIAFLHAQLG